MGNLCWKCDKPNRENHKSRGSKCQHIVCIVLIVGFDFWYPNNSITAVAT